MKTRVELHTESEPQGSDVYQLAQSLADAINASPCTNAEALAVLIVIRTELQAGSAAA